MRLYNDEPNFSIVCPGKCNANCSFCFWDETKCSNNYVDEMREMISALPQQDFRQVSITGGEPTLSPYFDEVVKEACENFEKVVITTNGAKLLDQMHVLAKHKRAYKTENFFLNISRHKCDDQENYSVFGTESVPSTEELEEIIDECSKLGIPVRANCVLTDEFDTRASVEKYIKWARSTGFDSIAFRKMHGDLDPSDQEMMFDDHEILSQGSCPVCYTKNQKIAGVNVQWKSSVSEPSERMNDVYELILQPDAKLTMDWDGEKEIISLEGKLFTPAEIIKLAKQGLMGVYTDDSTVYEDSSPSFGCGGSSRPVVTSGCGRSFGGCGS